MPRVVITLRAKRKLLLNTVSLSLFTLLTQMVSKGPLGFWGYRITIYGYDTMWNDSHVPQHTVLGLWDDMVCYGQCCSY